MKENIRIVILVALCIIPLSCSNRSEVPMNMDRVKGLDLSQYSSAPPAERVNLLFIHHSIGSQLLADRAPEPDAQQLYTMHPNGGGLRRLLEKNNYLVHEASFGSRLGKDTDICHWNAKFRDHMDEILACRNQDESYTDNTKNRVIMFKSCYPNSLIKSEGEAPGNPDSCEKTIANYKASYNALLPYFEKRPQTLFVILTAPPFAEPRRGQIKRAIERGFVEKDDNIVNVANRARLFNNWLKDPENGWLEGYPLKNVVVFDYYDVLTGYGKTNWSLYPTGDGRDSHPSSEGNEKAAREIVPFINQSIQRIDS